MSLSTSQDSIFRNNNSFRFLIKKRWIAIFVLVIFSFLIFYFKLNNFILWSQIEEFYTISDLSSFRAHSIRILLVNGLISFFQLFYEIDRMEAFHLIATVILFFSTIIFTKHVYIFVTKNIFLVVILSLSPILISFFQNGRGILGCFSILLLFNTLIIKNITTKWFYFFLAALFSNVSSGIFSVFLLTVFIGYSNNVFYYVKKIHLAFMLLIFSPLFIIYLNKNLEFYRYDFFELLSHGAGIIFHFDIILLIPVVLMFFLVFSIIFIYLIFVKPIIIYSKFFPFILASIIGLFFGYSSFNCFIYIYLFLFFEFFKNIMHSRNYIISIR